jgi:hypothetical protein
MSCSSPIALVGLPGSLFLPHTPSQQFRSCWNYLILTPCSPAIARNVGGSSIAVVLLPSTGTVLGVAGKRFGVTRIREEFAGALA